MKSLTFYFFQPLLPPPSTSLWSHSTVLFPDSEHFFSFYLEYLPHQIEWLNLCISEWTELIKSAMQLRNWIQRGNRDRSLPWSHGVWKGTGHVYGKWCTTNRGSMLRANGKCSWINWVRLIVKGLERLVDKTALDIASTRERLYVFEQWNNHSLKGRL